MSPYSPSPAAFYATAQGRQAAHLLGERLVRLWPPTAGLALLGVGYPLPYLDLWRPAPDRPGRCLAAIVGQLPRAAWPPAGPNRACAALHAALPFADLSFDRVLVVHGLELAGHGRRLLREVWRVLREDGRLIVVAPNRRGAWAHLESTPFGHGQPFSRGQLDRLLAGQAFRVERRDTALFIPPLPRGGVFGGARAADVVGRVLVQDFGGVTITEAVKEVFGAVPLLAGLSARARPPRRVLAETG